MNKLPEDILVAIAYFKYCASVAASEWAEKSDNENLYEAAKDLEEIIATHIGANKS